MAIAKVGDINLYYEDLGKGEPLVLVIGYTSHGGQWGTIRETLAKEYRVIVPDNRGAGRSDKPKIPYTAEMMAGDIAGLLDVLGIGAASVFGFSMGGAIAQEFALRYPGRLINLILGGTTCGLSKGVNDPEAMAFLAEFGATKQPVEEKVRIMIPWSLSRGFIESNPAEIEKVVATWCEYPAPARTFFCQGNIFMTFDTYDRLPDIKSPTLVIAGTEDRMFPNENSRILASRIPNAELAIIENAGHFFFIDSTEKAGNTVLDFLRRHSKACANN